MGIQKKGRLIFWSCIVVIVTASVILLVMSFGTRDDDTGNAVVDSGAGDWDLDAKDDKEKSPGDISIPGYGSMVMKAGQTRQIVDMGNPAENECYFKITILLDDGTRLYQSKLIEPGKGFKEIELEQALKTGTYPAVIRYDCYTYDDKKEPLNGAESAFTLDVREG